MSVQDAVLAIRAAFKARGWTQRQVSVRRDPCTHSSSITATIRDATIAHSAVQQIVGEHTHIRRDEASGEILSGGNTFTDVRYAEERSGQPRRRAAADPAPRSRSKQSHIDSRLRCPHCGVATWSNNYKAFMVDHDRPDGRRCQQAAASDRRR